MSYRLRKTFLMSLILVVFAVIFVFFMNSSKVSASDDLRVNERKFFTSYVVSDGDTLWSIAESYMTKEYTSVNEYIDELKKSNHLGSDLIQPGTLLVIPYYADAPQALFSH